MAAGFEPGFESLHSLGIAGPGPKATHLLARKHLEFW